MVRIFGFSRRNGKQRKCITWLFSAASILVLFYLQKYPTGPHNESKLVIGQEKLYICESASTFWSHNFHLLNLVSKQNDWIVRTHFTSSTPSAHLFTFPRLQRYTYSRNSGGHYLVYACLRHTHQKGYWDGCASIPPGLAQHVFRWQDGIFSNIHTHRRHHHRATRRRLWVPFPILIKTDLLTSSAAQKDVQYIYASYNLAENCKFMTLHAKDNLTNVEPHLEPVTKSNTTSNAWQFVRKQKVQSISCFNNAKDTQQFSLNLWVSTNHTTSWAYQFDIKGNNKSHRICTSSPS